MKRFWLITELLTSALINRRSPLCNSTKTVNISLWIAIYLLCWFVDKCTQKGHCYAVLIQPISTLSHSNHQINWGRYDRALKQRGRIDIWMTSGVIAQ